MSCYVNACIEKTLHTPARVFLGRLHKGVRAELIHIGWNLAKSMAPPGRKAASPEAADTASLVVEQLHAGSLIVDDIQDGSAVRRNAPAMHHIYGMPIALNVGNWLYFESMERIAELRLSPEAELFVYRVWNRTLLRAHQGQALDLGTTITEVPQDRIREICWHSMTLKTGALMGFSLQLGAILGGASVEESERIGACGERLGVLLQMFDDIGNLRPGQKQYEDLRQKRPTWLWYVASEASAVDYAELVSAVEQLPEARSLISWLEIHDLPGRALAAAEAFSRSILAELDVPTETSEQLRRTVERLSNAYR